MKTLHYEWKDPMRIALTVLFVIIFLLVMIANKDLITQAMKEVGLATLLLNFTNKFLNYWKPNIGYYTSKIGHVCLKI